MEDKESDSYSDTLMNISLVYHSLGKTQKAVDFMNHSMTIVEKSQGKESIQCSFRFHNLGMFYRKLGLFPECIKCYKKSILIKERMCGK